MSTVKESSYCIKTDEQKSREAQQYWDWVRHIQTYSPSGKPLDYDGELFYTKREFRKKYGLSEQDLKVAIRSGELNGRPLKRITKKAFFEKAKSKIT